MGVIISDLFCILVTIVSMVMQTSDISRIQADLRVDEIHQILSLLQCFFGGILPSYG